MAAVMCDSCFQRELSGERDLSNVSYLEVCVDSQNSSLGNFGEPTEPPSLCVLCGWR